MDLRGHQGEHRVRRAIQVAKVKQAGIRKNRCGSETMNKGDKALFETFARSAPSLYERPLLARVWQKVCHVVASWDKVPLIREVDLTSRAPSYCGQVTKQSSVASADPHNDLTSSLR